MEILNCEKVAWTGVFGRRMHVGSLASRHGRIPVDLKRFLSFRLNVLLKSRNYSDMCVRMYVCTAFGFFLCLVFIQFSNVIKRPKYDPSCSLLPERDPNMRMSSTVQCESLKKDSCT